MTGKKVFFYVGLPKTGSAFLRQEVFTKLDTSRVCVNPEDVVNVVQKMHASHYSPANIDAVKNAAAKAFGNIDQDIVLVTDLDLVGLAVDNFRRFEEITDFMKELFPEASIIITLRNQVDWLLSLYKHTTTGLDVSITEFLNFSGGKFNSKQREDFPNVDALDFNFAEKCEYYVKAFGKENVHVLLNEDMVSDPEGLARQIEGIFGCDMVGNINFRTENKSFSSFGIQITLCKEKLGKLFGREGRQRKEDKILHRIISWLEQYDIGNELWRDAIRKKGALYAPAILLKRLLLRLRWDHFIRNVVDRIVYLDWDMLGKERRKILSRHYSRLNEGLRPYFKNRETENRYIATAQAES